MSRPQHHISRQTADTQRCRPHDTQRCRPQTLAEANVMSFKGDRESEKLQLQILNERLASYIEKVVDEPVSSRSL